jgi:hypothetical protein
MGTTMKARGIIFILLYWLLTGWYGASTLPARAHAQELTISASFADQTVNPDTPLEWKLSRPLAPNEGRPAVLIGATDVTNVMLIGTQTLRYEPRAVPLPSGETTVTLYLITAADEWREMARFVLRVNKAASTSASTTTTSPAVDTNASAPAADATQAANTTQAAPTPTPRTLGFDKFEWVPQLNVGLKAQFAETHFPATNQPQRTHFNDFTLSGSLRSDMARGPFSVQTQYDMVGSSFRGEALRFGVLGQQAPHIDLSNYQMQFQYGTSKLVMGHTSYGAHRHLINNFNSRGMTLTIPFAKRFDVTLATMNSTSIVGWSNFLGVSNTRHQFYSGTLGFEVFAARPGALRLEIGALSAYTQPRANFNQGNVNDLERSQGGTARLKFSDKTQRIRFDSGFTRSRFNNPNDPLLSQGAPVVAVNIKTRNAHYADLSVDLLKDFLFRKPPAQPGDTPAQAPDTSQLRKLNLTLNVRHERVDPLYRSIGAQTQADRFNTQAELTGSYGELNFTAARTGFHDNLAGIPTLVQTLTNTDLFAINVPLSVLAKTPAQQSDQPQFAPALLLPRLGYTFTRIRATLGNQPRGFDNPSALPNLASYVQTLTAEWQFPLWRVTYQLNHSLTDNRAADRERSDLQNFVHVVSIGWTPRPTLSVNFETNFEDANNREQAQTNRTLRFGINTNWQMNTRQTWNLTFTTIGAGNLVRTQRNRNLELDLQWNYRLTREHQNRFKKYQVNYFVRYSNRYARTLDSVFGFNSLTRLNTFNTGLNFIFF